MTLAKGYVLHNRYHIRRVLGQGGMATVYEAHDAVLNCSCAVKEMVPDPAASPQALVGARDQFRREAQVLATLRHPGLPRVIDHFEERGHAYLVMDFVQGESLAERLERLKGRPLPEHLAVGWTQQLLDALEYCHRHNVIHRDIKPHNAIVTPDGRVVLVDFGLLKLYDPSRPGTATVVRGMGTPEYTPPEQYDAPGTGRTDARSDIYALGATLYHLVTGEALLTATQRMADPHSFHRPRQLNASVSPQTESVILKAIEIPRDRRFQSAAEMRAALGPQTRRPQVPPPTPPTPTRKAGLPVWVWMLGGLAVLSLVVGMVMIVGSGATPTHIHTPTATTADMLTAIPTDTDTLAVLATNTPAPTQTLAPTNTPAATPLLPTSTPAVPVAGTTWTRPADGMVMVYVPGGEFEMGSDDGAVDYALQLYDKYYYYDDCKRSWFEDEQPEHTVYLDGFWIDRTEVTNAQYRQCVKAGDCERPSRSGSDSRDSYYGNSAYDNYPVIYVGRPQAEAYCTWAGGRLPTEAEWEYAARGPEGRVFPWGDRFDGERLNYCDANCRFDWADGTVDDGYADTAPVGAYPAGASPYGALDMGGNVWEWVADCYDSGYYSRSPSQSPASRDSGAYRVLRGGSWLNAPYDVRSANRDRGPWDGTNYRDVGFRCARGSE